MGRGDMNSFAPLRDAYGNEDKEEVTTKDATTKSGGGSARKDTTKKSGGGETMKKPYFDLFRVKSKAATTEDSMGGKSESSSNSPIPSVLAKVSFATTTGRNVMELNNLKPNKNKKSY
jgi:hypothetical protein